MILILINREIFNDYHNWLMELCDDLTHPYEYGKLFEYLESVDFYSKIRNDDNRIDDGRDLRLRFAESSREWTYRDVYLYLYDAKCSILEMMAALAFRCEETIMSDSNIGDRTNVWFCDMLRSLHLYEMTDENFDENYVRNAIDIFLKHKYEPNGDGGLFTLKNPPEDLRKVEIWYQMCWYLNEYELDL